MTNSELAIELRKLADIYAHNSEINQPHNLTLFPLTIYCHSKEEFANTIRAFGDGNKSYSDEHLIFTPNSPKFVIKIEGFKYMMCEQVVTGTEEIPEQIIPARPATKEIRIPATTKKITEWRCPPFIKD